jgi:transcriptional regulator with XRE-family HTH domain
MRVLAPRAGISQPFLSQLERGQSSPSLLTLYRLAEALGVNPGDLMPTEEPSTTMMVRANEGQVIAATESVGEAIGRIIFPTADRTIEILEYSVNPSNNVPDWFTSERESAIYLFAGVLEVEVENQGKWTMQPRDALFQSSGRVRTRWTSTGPATASLLLITTRPSAT